MIQNVMKDPLMVLGTSSGAGKSLMATAICRVLKKRGEIPVPFKGQNMSNNAWVDKNGGEMAYSQALQAWASGLEPISAMNPVLLKPKGDCTSEVIHLGKSAGIAQAKTYYKDWYISGWQAICQGITKLEEENQNARFILEGAGSPVEVNLQKRDLTNLKLAKYLKANCILVADIERGGVFAQIIGTLTLMSPKERSLVKGLLINRFRGEVSLFDEGRKWLEQKTNIPVIGVMPWIKELFPPEDSLDLFNRKAFKGKTDIEIAIIKLPFLSNFSDLDPLESEPSVKLKWIEPGSHLGEPDAVIIPGSKQTIKDLELLFSSGLGEKIQKYAKKGGHLFGICGGMQMLGEMLYDPFQIEGLYKSQKAYKGLGLLPISTKFKKEKIVRTRNILAMWPNQIKVTGFELHHGESQSLEKSYKNINPMFEDDLLGWVNNEGLKFNTGGTYLHGIFDNGMWRRMWLNKIRRRKGLNSISEQIGNYSERKEQLITLLAEEFEKHVNLSKVLNS